MSLIPWHTCIISKLRKILGEDWLEFFATEILYAKYEWTEIRDIVQQMDHLSQTH